MFSVMFGWGPLPSGEGGRKPGEGFEVRRSALIWPSATFSRREKASRPRAGMPVLRDFRFGER